MYVNSRRPSIVGIMRVILRIAAIVGIAVALPSGCAARTSFAKAVHAQNLGNFREATQLYRMVVAKNANNAIAHYNLGTCFFQLRDFDEAASAFEQAIRGFRAVSADSMWTIGGESKTRRQMLALALNDLGACHYNQVGASAETRAEKLQTAIRYFKEAIDLDGDLRISQTNLANARQQPLYVPGASKTLYLDADQAKLLVANWTAIIIHMVESLAESGTENVLLLPVQGTSHFTFPDPEAMHLTWPHGSLDAEREAIRKAHETQNIPSIQAMFKTGLTEVGVPLVARDAESIKAILDEWDFASVFGSSEDMANIRRLVRADAVCSVTYNQFYDCFIEYSDGIPKQPVSHTRYVLTVTCADVRDGRAIFNAVADTEAIRKSPVDTFGQLDPYFVIALAGVDPSLFARRAQPMLRNPEVLLARAMVHAHPMYSDMLHDTDLADKLIQEAKEFRPLNNPRWLYYAELSHALGVGDRKKMDRLYQSLMAETSDWAAWWRERIRSYYIQYKKTDADGSNQ